jgi:hypothetical protein
LNNVQSTLDIKGCADVDMNDAGDSVVPSDDDNDDKETSSSSASSSTVAFPPLTCRKVIEVGFIIPSSTADGVCNRITRRGELYLARM